MKNNILRQLKDIQYQADRFLTGRPTLSDVRNFGKYSTELKSFLLEEVELSEIRKLIYQIPDISEEDMNIRKSGWLVLLPPILWTWYYEGNILEEAREKIHIAKGKYASVEFMLKNYLS